MSRDDMPKLAGQIREKAAAFCESNKIPGYLAGVYHDQSAFVTAHGIASVASGALMREDTGFLIGSITKILTTTLILQQVEKGVLDLDARVVDYMPEFTQNAPATTADLRIRHLLTHSNGIDADLYFPEDEGREALKGYLEGLWKHCGVLFGPGRFVSYSNGGMIVAGRLLERIEGAEYGKLLSRDLFARIGMKDACTSVEQAILRSTAVGHFLDPTTMTSRPTMMFKLPDTWAPAGSTATGTIRDLLAFGRTHLPEEVASLSTPVLSRDWIHRMQAVAHDMGTPNVPPMGLGWSVIPFGKTSVLGITGTSPGGVAILLVVPSSNFVFAAYANDPRGMQLHDKLAMWLLTEHLGVEIPDLLSGPTPESDLTPFAGTYRSNQLRVDVRVVNCQLEEKVTYEPQDESQAYIVNQLAGGSAFGAPARHLVAVGKGLFAPAGMPLQGFNGFSRQMLVSFHGEENGIPQYRSSGGRIVRRGMAS